MLKLEKGTMAVKVLILFHSLIFIVWTNLKPRHHQNQPVNCEVFQNILDFGRCLYLEAAWVRNVSFCHCKGVFEKRSSTKQRRARRPFASQQQSHILCPADLSTATWVWLVRAGSSHSHLWATPYMGHPLCSSEALALLLIHKWRDLKGSFRKVPVCAMVPLPISLPKWCGVPWGGLLKGLFPKDPRNLEPAPVEMLEEPLVCATVLAYSIILLLQDEYFLFIFFDLDSSPLLEDYQKLKKK